MGRKGSQVTSFLSLITFVGIMIGVVYKLFGGWAIFWISESIDMQNNYFLTEMDKNVQSIKHGFIKTAAFSALEETFEELITHGNIPANEMGDPDSDGYVDGVYPCLKVEEYDGETIPFWNVVGNRETYDRVPFLAAKNPRKIVGEGDYYPAFNDDGHLTHYIEDVAADTYDLHVLIGVLMLKKGEVEITGGSGVTMERASTTPEVITSDGLYEYTITNIDPANLASVGPISVHFRALNESSEVDNVAQINYFSMTVYDNDILSSQNRLFTQYLEDYQLNMYDILDRRNSDASNDISIEMGPLYGLYTPSSFLKGTVWAGGDGIDLQINDLNAVKLGGASVSDEYMLAHIKSSGLVEEEVKLRHYKMTEAGQFIVQNTDLMKDEILEELEDLADYYHESYTNDCKEGPECPDDHTAKYNGIFFTNLIKDGLQDAENQLENTFNVDGIEFEFIGPTSIKTECVNSHTNDRLGSSSPEDNCLGGFEDHVDGNYDSYLFYTEHIRSSCSESECERIPHDHGPDQVWYEVTCSMTYAHQYILKNIKVLVQVKDTKYKYYDIESESWENPVLQFYITLDRIDDNDCNGNTCSNVETTDTTC